jgi:predicted RNase H-like HicB family nuclease
LLFGILPIFCYTVFVMKKTVLKKKIYEYDALFEKYKGYYVVTVPTLPGLVTQGDNLADAIYMTKDAIKCYLEALLKDKVLHSCPQKIQRRLRVSSAPHLNYA